MREDIQQDLEQKEEKVLLLEKGKRGILNIIFGRTTVVMLLLLLQFLVLFAFFSFLGEYIIIAFGSSFAFSIMMIILLINRSMNPAMKLTWAILILALPIFGALLYIFVETDFGHRLLHKRLEYLIKESRPYLPKRELSEPLKEEKRDLYNLEQYTLKHGGFPAYENTEIKYFASGEAKFEALLCELEKAEKFIFLEYIFQTGNRFRSKPIKLPSPEFYVFYNGPKDFSVEFYLYFDNGLDYFVDDAKTQETYKEVK